jgi:hypothetical protein
MASLARPKLTIPTVLVISALAVGCPAGDDADTGNETGPSTTTATTGDTGLDTGATAGEVPDCASLDEVMCNADPACFWEGTEIGCLVNCSMLEDQATCESGDYCEWFEDACYSTI